MMFYCLNKFDVYDLVVKHLFIIILFLIIVIRLSQVTFVGAIRRHITILDYKRLAVYIIFDNVAPQCVEIVINVDFVQV